jgi:hypothetical protein
LESQAQKKAILIEKEKALAEASANQKKQIDLLMAEQKKIMLQAKEEAAASKKELEMQEKIKQIALEKLSKEKEDEKLKII